MILLTFSVKLDLNFLGYIYVISGNAKAGFPRKMWVMVKKIKKRRRYMRVIEV